MSFGNSFDYLIYHNGQPPQCAGSRVHETWFFKQGLPLQKTPFRKDANEPVENWIDWLNTADSTSSPSLKVLVVRTEPMVAPMNDDLFIRNAEVLKRLFEAVKLPIAGLGAYLRNMVQYSCVPLATPGAFSYFFSDPTVGLTWSYCPSTRSTRAILLCREMKINHHQENCRAILERHKDFIDQPQLLSYVCTESMSSRASYLINDLIIPEVLQIERLTGLETWNPGREEVLDKLPNGQGEEDNLSVILYSQRLTDIRFRLTALREYVPIVRREIKRHSKFLQTQDETEYDGLQDSLERTVQLDNIMEYFHEYLKVRLLKVESLAERIGAQVVAVEKLQALKRSEESHLIAMDSKRIAQDSQLLAQEGTRDSKGMMTIAAVTMFFLPGTFIAAFFAMPIFHWDAPPNSAVVSSRIWIYWAVTVPLTVIVLGTWVLYRFLSSKKEQIEDEELVGKSYRGKGLRVKLRSRR